MLVDIIDYLVEFVGKNKYSLLNKRCRDVYFRKYGIHIYKPYIPMLSSSLLLLKYSIYCDYSNVDIGNSFLSAEFITHNRTDIEQIKKIRLNLKKFKHPRYSFWMDEMLEEYPNLTEFSVAYDVGPDFNDAQKVLKTLKWIGEKYETYGKEKIKIFLIPLYFLVNNEYSDILKRLGALGCRFYGPISPPKLNELITDLKMYPYDNGGNLNDLELPKYPNLTTLHYTANAENLAIDAPKLTTISSTSLIVSMKLVQKYPTIKNLRKTILFEFGPIEESPYYMDFADFNEAYSYLYNFDFDLKYANGVILDRQNFIKLMDLERHLKAENIKKGKPRFYRSLEALIDFSFSNLDTELVSEYRELFDLTNVKFVSL